MLTIVATHRATSAEVECDLEDDFEVLRFQVLSLFEELGNEFEFVLVDFAGREVTAVSEVVALQASATATATASDVSSGVSSEEMKVHLWVVESSFKDMCESICSSVVFLDEQGEGEGQGQGEGEGQGQGDGEGQGGSREGSGGDDSVAEGSGGIIQPRFRIIDTPFDLCICCKKHVSPGLLQASNSNMMTLQPFSCQGKKAFEFGLTLDSYTQQFSLQSDVGNATRTSRASPVGKYLQWHYLQAAIGNQVLYGHGGSGPISEGERQVEGRLRSGLKTVQVYEDFEQQRKSRDCIDFEKICQRAEVIRQNSPIPLAEDVLCMKALLEWFKHDFFKWFKKPNCSTQGCPGATAIANIHPCGGSPPTTEEQQRDWAGRVELYQCKDCNSIIRFPRINNPSRLLETRVGRCGEFANAFCLICRSLGIDANWVLDFTDHVWVEVYLPSLGRYVHADPCEKSLDAPLTYEVGWNKKLNYIFSFSRFGVADVIHRYSRKFTTTVSQNRTLCSEKFLQDRVKAVDQLAQNWYYQQRVQTRESEGYAELTLLRFRSGSSAFSPSYYTKSHIPSDLATPDVLNRKYCQERELRMLMFLQSTACSPDELQGRISGDKDWKLSRGEIGNVGLNKNDNGLISYRDIDEMKWLADGMTLSTHRGGASVLYIFVSSVGNDDEIDNSSNNYISDIAMQHSRYISDSAISSVLTPYRICVNSCPVLKQPGRGHNVTLLCAHTGAFKSSKSFDTWGNETAGDDMVAFLEPYLFPLSKSEAIPKEGFQQIYVMIVTVLDSGENGGEALCDFFAKIIQSGKCSNNNVCALPSHRESWAMVAYIGEQQRQVKNSKIDCADCSGNLFDIDNKIDTIPTTKLDENFASFSIIPYLELVHVASSLRGAGPTMAKITLPLLSRHLSPDTGELISVPLETVVKNNGCFQEIEMHVPVEVTSCMLPHPNETLPVFIERVKSLSRHDSKSSGFVIILPESDTVVSSLQCMDEVRAFFFSSAGFPLRRITDGSSNFKKSKVYVKSSLGETAAEKSNCGIGCGIASSCLKYVSLGGKRHPDTVGFDTTLGLTAMSSMAGCPMANIHLADVRFFGGDIVESLRCRYVLSDKERQHLKPLGIWSSQLGATLSDETVHPEPENLDIITSVSIKHGNLVDSITLHYGSGSMVKAGGNGGSTNARVDVDVAGGERVIGFYGGVGGHLHHFGVVLFRPGLISPQYNPPASLSNNVVEAALCDLASKHRLWSNRISTLLLQQGLAHLCHFNVCLQYNGSKLIGSIASLITSNGIAAVRKCLQTTMLYTVNVIRNMENPKYHVVKFTNKSFQSFVASLESGLSFFQCSPVYWTANFFDICLQCNEELIKISEHNTELKSKWLEAMSDYCAFLSDVLKLEHMQVAS